MIASVSFGCISDFISRCEFRGVIVYRPAVLTRKRETRDSKSNDKICWCRYILPVVGANILVIIGLAALFLYLKAR